MPVLDYFGNLWGFQAKDERGVIRWFCSNCYRKLRGDKKISEAEYALGTGDPADEDNPRGKRNVYICDECGESSK